MRWRVGWPFGRQRLSCGDSICIQRRGGIQWSLGISNLPVIRFDGGEPNVVLLGGGIEWDEGCDLHRESEILWEEGRGRQIRPVRMGVR